ncbi:FAD-binding protein [Caenispirillum bisanense]|uniref:FAD binding domain-containing protein n=1 Tax=Caenispirillum bisanense TaxID=414052 RepID=A0A286GTC6_9PROT|nr:FAD-binding protein [Caenispirillum bisanense]SOD98770.1 FAD binding domain-containing protein [Caenispirillum bisanense]
MDLNYFFNEAYYLRRYSDVRDGVNKGVFTSGLQHYLEYGVREDRDPHPFIDVSYYLDNNSDIAASVAAGRTLPFHHFLVKGAAEARAPSAFFDSAFYLLYNTDVRVAAFRGETTAFEHFSKNGRGEGRVGSPFFDPIAYLNANPDIRTAVNSGIISAHDHFVNFGVAEYRNLGNGIDLAFFRQDTTFTTAINVGNFGAAFDRVSDVAPFMASWQKPKDYVLPSTLAVPETFTPPAGQGLVLPAGSTLKAPSKSTVFSTLTVSLDAASSTVTLGGTPSKDGTVVDLSATTQAITDGTLTLSLGTGATWANVSAAAMKDGGLTLVGNGSANTLTASIGGSTLNGGGGDDVLKGGAGVDTFIFADGTKDAAWTGGADTITGFTKGSDKLSITQADLGGLGNGDTVVDNVYIGAVGAATAGTDYEVMILTGAGYADADAAEDAIAAQITSNGKGGTFIFYDSDDRVARMAFDPDMGADGATGTARVMATFTEITSVASLATAFGASDFVFA